MNGAQVLAQFVEAVEVRTAATPPVRVEVAKLGQPGGAPSRLLTWLKPTVVVKSPATGDYTAAPYGEAPPWQAGAVLLASGVLLVLGGAFGAGYLLGSMEGGK